MKKESPLRSVIKGIVWRIIATLTTIIIAFLVTGDIETGLQIGLWEFFIKLVIYYLHERVWQFAYRDGIVTKTESFLKTLSWRIAASTTTGLIAFFAIKSGAMDAAGSKALIIVIFEATSKMALYYVHERLWLKVPLGTFRRIIGGRKSNTAQ